MGKRGRCGLQETRGAHKMKRIRIKLSSFRLCALCVLFLQNPALLRGDDGLATATRHIMRGAATAATYTQTAGKLRWAWSLQESDHLGSGRLGVRLLASGGVGSILRLSGGRGVPRNGLESGEGGYGEYDSDGDGDVDGDDVEATRRGQQQQGAGDAGVDGDEPGGSDDDMAARLVNGAGDEWEERHKQNQEAMQNMKGFANEEAFLQAKQAYEDGDEDAFEKMQKKVVARHVPFLICHLFCSPSC